MSAATEMRSKFLAFAVAAALAAPLVPAQAAVSDFRLPDPSEQQPPPDRQGPVAPDVPESRRPAPTPTPTASTPTPSPVVAPPPVIVAPPISAAPTAEPTRPTPTQGRTSPPPSPVPTASTPAATASAEPLPTSAPTISADPAPAVRAEPEDEGGSLWPLVLGGLLALGALGFAAWAWARKRRGSGADAVPEIERPHVVPHPPLAPAPAAPAPTPQAPLAPAPARAPLPVPTMGEPLEVSLEPLRLSLTLMNAALAWRLEVANRGSAPLTGLTIGADMISAHASMSRQEQLAGPGSAALTVQRIERLEPGESRTVEGEFRLPFGQIVPIRQGNAALLLPLARFRVEAEDAKPVVRTFAVGQPGNGSGLQPFRLDQGPRVYPKLAQRAFA